MTEFKHSIVLFTGEDGLPIEFNIQYVAYNKAILKALIEHGGGSCTLQDNVMHLVSPGTKVLNVDLSYDLISTKYIYDCVKENLLLETDEYRFQINEMETSDISDNSENLIGGGKKLSDDIVDNSNEIANANKSLSPNVVTCPSSNHDFDFEDSESRSNPSVAIKENPESHNAAFLASSSKIIVTDNVSPQKEKNFDSSRETIPDIMDALPESVEYGQNLIECNRNLSNVDMEMTCYTQNITNKEASIIDRSSPVSAKIVSSSQPHVDGLDKFDNMVLNIAENNVLQEEEDSSQNCTVSSSADAQVSPKAAPHDTSAEIFDGSSVVPDSASQTAERQQYIKDLETEIDEILKKPSPKSIQDKIVLVKYICTVKKLPPAVVLQALQKL